MPCNETPSLDPQGLEFQTCSGFVMWSYSFSIRQKVGMQLRPQKRTYNVEVEFQNGLTRNVKVKATTRDQAEQKALKFHPSAIRVKNADVA